MLNPFSMGRGIFHSKLPLVLIASKKPGWPLVEPPTKTRSLSGLTIGIISDSGSVYFQRTLESGLIA